MRLEGLGFERTAEHAGRVRAGRVDFRWVTACFTLVTVLGSAFPADAGSGRRRNTPEPVGFQLFESPHVNPIALSANGSQLYVALTTARRVVVLSTATLGTLASIDVGVDPVAIAVRPGHDEVWVSNHVSDTVSVIDVGAGSPTRFRVIDVVQSFDAQGVTSFDEPAGIAFSADGSQAFVALSSRDEIAVIDADSRAVTGRIPVRAQDPRAIAVRNGLLYVAAFESGNRSELSACPLGGTPPQCTLGASALVSFATNPNLPGEIKNIVEDPLVPDRDLFVYDVATHAEVGVASGVGTLLYGLAVSGSGRAFLAQTDARNAVNGLDGQNLIDLDNRMFSNQVAAVSCSAGGCAAPQIADLEPPGPTPATAMATPYGIALSADDATLVVTLAGSSRVATLDAASLAVLDVLDLGAGASFGQQIPRGVALRSGASGAAQTAYVLNAFENTVSVIDASNRVALAETAKVPLAGDPTPDAVRRGRIVFHSGFASTSGTFSCGSCHPDANVDQLLWRIGGACSFGACNGHDQPRTTMPIRGLKDTLPLHWDGALGDPFGGPNGAVGGGVNLPPSCAVGGPDGDLDCFLDLVLSSLSGVMCDQTGPCPPGGNVTTAQQRSDLATFLGSVSYPPARSRRIDDTLSTPANPVAVPNGDGSPSALGASALKGFQDFFTNQGGFGPNTCADSDAGCHALPLGTATNSAVVGQFDAPTMRGMTDRFVQFSAGITAPQEVLSAANAGQLGGSPLETPIRWDPARGFREITTFGVAFGVFEPVYNVRPLDIFQMFEEASTGFSGAQARQVALNTRALGPALRDTTETLLAALELADFRGLVNLQVSALYDPVGTGSFAPVLLSFKGGIYSASGFALTPEALLTAGEEGRLIGTATAQLRSGFVATGGPQPLLAPLGTGSNGVTGDPPLPVVAAGNANNPPPMTLQGRRISVLAVALVDGQPVSAGISCNEGIFDTFCVEGSVTIDLGVGIGLTRGLHLLQVQNPAGPLSNELPFCVGNAGDCN